MYTEHKARKMLNQPENNQRTNQILAMSGSILVIFAVISRTFYSLDVDSQYIQIMAWVIAMTVIGIVLPFLVIYRNENLKNWAEYTINALLPVIYVPSFLQVCMKSQNQVYDINSVDFMNVE